MKKGQVVFHADGGDDAVHGFPDGLALFPAFPVNPGGIEVGVDAFRLIDRKFLEVVFYPFEIFIFFDSLKNFGEDYLRQADVLFIFYEPVKQTALRRVCAPEKINPYAGSDQDSYPAFSGTGKITSPFHLAFEFKDFFPFYLAHQLLEGVVNKLFFGLLAGEFHGLFHKLFIEFYIGSEHGENLLYTQILADSCV